MTAIEVLFIIMITMMINIDRLTTKWAMVMMTAVKVLLIVMITMMMI